MINEKDIIANQKQSNCIEMASRGCLHTILYAIDDIGMIKAGLPSLIFELSNKRRIGIIRQVLFKENTKKWKARQHLWCYCNQDKYNYIVI